VNFAGPDLLDASKLQVLLHLKKTIKPTNMWGFWVGFLIARGRMQIAYLLVASV